MGNLASEPRADENRERRNAVGSHTCQFMAYAIGRDTVLWEGLRVIFSGSSFKVVTIATDFQQALRTLEPARPVPVPHIALLDLSSGVTRVRHQIGHLLSAFPDVRVVVLADTAQAQVLRECILAGAHSYLTKDIDAKSLILSLRMTMLGKRVYPTRAMGSLLVNNKKEGPTAVYDKNTCGLSRREMQIVNLVLLGESNKMIANSLAITESTVKGHVNRILRKTKVSNRTQAAIMVAAAGTLSEWRTLGAESSRGEFSPLVSA